MYVNNNPTMQFWTGIKRDYVIKTFSYFYWLSIQNNVLWDSLEHALLPDMFQPNLDLSKSCLFFT